MVSGVWGKKVGMTQIFADDKVIPVTAIDISRWVVTNIKTAERDGYNALQVGCLRDRYAKQEFSHEWLKNLKKFFGHIREIRTAEAVTDKAAGQEFDSAAVLAKGDKVNVTGTTRGRGFTGGVKRHGFSGGRRSHGCTMGERSSGSISWMRKQGRIIKGKTMAGHMGVDQNTVRNLPVVKVEAGAHIVLVKGAVPGHAGSLVFVRKV